MLTILVGTIVIFIFGAVWYTFLFGKTWAKLMGFDSDGGDMKGEGMAKPMIMNFILNLVLVFAFYKVFPVYKSADMVTWQVVFFSWLAFVFPVYANAAVWERKSWKLVLINVAYSLLLFTILSWVMGYMM